MKYQHKLFSKFSLAGLLTAFAINASADTIPQNNKPVWHIGAELTPSMVVRATDFLKGNNLENKSIDMSLTPSVKAGFSFNPNSRIGRTYPGLYQGIGLDMRTFFAPKLMGTPVSVFVYQGAPFARFGSRLTLGYEWEFGLAFGWKYHHEELQDNNGCIGTPVTAHMGAALKLQYSLTDRLLLSVALKGAHFSNGNTESPNGGINTIGLGIGLTYILNPTKQDTQLAAPADADRPEWFYDIMAFGAVRKRIVSVNPVNDVCPGKFAVAGLQFAPMRKFNRWFAAGPALDFHYDESAGIEPYYAGGIGNTIIFYRPPLGKQLSLGLSAHAELTAAIFAVNAGIGYEFICPVGDKPFYQSLTLKAFITRKLFLNIGYRLGNFSQPQNLMLGVGVRL